MLLAQIMGWALGMGVHRHKHIQESGVLEL